MGARQAHDNDVFEENWEVKEAVGKDRDDENESIDNPEAGGGCGCRL